MQERYAASSDPQLLRGVGRSFRGVAGLLRHDPPVRIIALLRSMAALTTTWRRWQGPVRSVF